jgi:poly-gamma-glutamate capsule biosynthesis protein CapA/YwtB (metallophosphatase superfamily)
LTASTPAPEPAGTKLSTAEAHAIRFAAVGSAMFQTRLRSVPDPGFQRLFTLIRDADAAFVNLEAPIREPSSYPVKQYVYTSYVTSEPWVTEELTWAGFNLVSLANNHMADWSPASIRTNQRLLDEAGITWSGAGMTLGEARAPGFLDTPRGRVALVSVDSSYEFEQYYQVQMASDPHGSVPGRPGTNGLRWDTCYDLDSRAFEDFRQVHVALGLHRQGMETTHLTPHPSDDVFRFRGVVVRRRNGAPRITTRCRPSDLSQIVRWIESAREQADYVLVSHHNHQAAGVEWEEPVDFVREFAHAAIDAGADAYIGHGYTPKGIEIHRNRPIFYDIGDWSTQDAAARRHPGDSYDRWGLDPTATPGEFADAREAARAFAREQAGDEAFRQSVRAYSRAVGQSALVRFSFNRDTLDGIELHPCLPREHRSRHLRNLPQLAQGEAADRVIERFADASAPFGTKIENRDGVGHVVLDRQGAA